MASGAFFLLYRFFYEQLHVNFWLFRGHFHAIPLFFCKIACQVKFSEMRTNEFRIFVYEYDRLDALNPEDQELMLAAREAAGEGYAPYSGFFVGAALRLEDGQIIRGNNQENAAFPSGVCAERVALYYANANFSGVSVTSMAVTASNRKGLVEGPVRPCGSCRQALIETEFRFQKKIRIILDGKEKIEVFDGVENLLPFAFRPGSLG